MGCLMGGAARSPRRLQELGVHAQLDLLLQCGGSAQGASPASPHSAIPFSCGMQAALMPLFPLLQTWLRTCGGAQAWSPNTAAGVQP